MTFAESSPGARSGSGSILDFARAIPRGPARTRYGESQFRLEFPPQNKSARQDRRGRSAEEIVDIRVRRPNSRRKRWSEVPGLTVWLHSCARVRNGKREKLALEPVNGTNRVKGGSRISKGPARPGGGVIIPRGIDRRRFKARPRGNNLPRSFGQLFRRKVDQNVFRRQLSFAPSR